MPKWLSRTLLVILALVVLGGALFGAYTVGRRVGMQNIVSANTDPTEFNPRLDRDQFKPNLRAESYRPFAWAPDMLHGFDRFPMLGFFLGFLFALARLGLLVLLIWLVVRWVLHSQKPAPAVANPPPAPEPPADLPPV